MGAPRVNWRDRVRVWRDLPATPKPAGSTDRAEIVIVGAGPVGLAMAIELGQRGHRVTVVSRFDFVPAGSKAICFSKRSLEILDQLGVGDAAVDRGVVWNVGKVFWKDRAEPIYQFDMLPVKNQKMPGFINLQQYHLEDLLIERASQLPAIELRWGHELTGMTWDGQGARLGVSAPDGEYHLEARWVIACDGSRSTVRELMGLDFEGRAFEDNFLIADIRMQGEQPPERWFWFDPPFNPGRSVLMHKQPDNVWRLDFQLGWDVDRDAAIKPDNVGPMVRAMLGEDLVFEEEWYSVYTFQCRRMASFIHGPVIFAGDSAHLVSPFGARGCNGGFADVANLGWKLDLVLRGAAGLGLLASYDHEATVTADENILNSTRSTDFLVPKSPASHAFRDAVLELAAEQPFARAFVNSGRLATAVSYPDSPLNTPDDDTWEGGAPPGSPVPDAPTEDGWLLERLGGDFTVVHRGAAWAADGQAVDISEAPVAVERLALPPGGACLVRPDLYVAARFKAPTAAKIGAARDRAMGGRPLGA